MRGSKQALRNFSLPRACILLIPVLLLFFGCEGSDSGPATGTVTVSRPWIHETEFVQNPLLRADPTQIIILDVTPGEGDIQHFIPYEFTTSDSYRLCLSNDEEHIMAVTLYDSRSTVMAHINHSNPCSEFSVSPGYYNMTIVHDGTTVIGETIPGFITLLNKNPPTSDLAGQQDAESANSGILDMDESSSLILKADNGNFLQLGGLWSANEPSDLCYDKSYGNKTNIMLSYPDCTCPQWCGEVREYMGAYPIEAKSSSEIVNLFKFNLGGTVIVGRLDPYSGFQQVNLTNKMGSSVPGPFYLQPFWLIKQWTEVYHFQPFLYAISILEMHERNAQAFGIMGTSSEFTLTLDDMHLAPMDSSNLLRMGVPHENIQYLKVFGKVTADIPTLNKGEMALFSSCSTDAAGPAYVFAGNQADLSALPTSPPLKGIKLGPDTAAMVYSDQNYQGKFFGVGSHEITCIDGLDSIGSIKMITSLDLLVTTKSCVSCDLEKAPLSRYNLDNCDLSYANLKGANLSCASMNGTNMTNANLTSAKIDSSGSHCTTTTFESVSLANADFSSATLDSVSFESSSLANADFSSATLDSVSFAEGVKMMSANFSGATLKNNVKFSGADCSNMNLSGAKLDAVSFEGNDLSLEMVDFSTTGSLKDVTLDGNIGCASFHNMDLVSLKTEKNLTILETCTYGTDYFCRTDFSGATLDLGMFTECESASTSSSADVATCLGRIRYFNLDNANLENYKTVLTSSLEYSLDLKGAILSNLNLSGVTLDYADMSCADLSNCTDLSETDLSSSSLKNVKLQGAKMHGSKMKGVTLDYADMSCADLSNCTDLSEADLSWSSLKNVNLQGAKMYNTTLNNSNLESANLNSADLGTSGSTVSAKFSGAYMKNVNLSEVNGSGVSFDHASFYSGTPGKCSPKSWQGNCATAVGASLNNANFSGAFLNGVDFSGATLTGVTFTSASMFATTFDGAKMEYDKFTGDPTNMDYALLGGADFSAVGDISGVSFESATGTSEGQTICQPISGKTTLFFGFGEKGNPGYCSPAASDCTSRQQGDATCVSVSYNVPTKWPSGTDHTNTCYGGNPGPCDAASWHDVLPSDCKECLGLPGSTCTNGDYVDMIW